MVQVGVAVVVVVGDEQRRRRQDDDVTAEMGELGRRRCPWLANGKGEKKEGGAVTREASDKKPKMSLAQQQDARELL